MGKYSVVILLIFCGFCQKSQQIWHQNEQTTKPPNQLDRNWYTQSSSGVTSQNGVIMHHNYSRTVSYQGTAQPGVKGKSFGANYVNEFPEATTSKHIQRIAKKHETHTLTSQPLVGETTEPQGYLECPYQATGQFPYALDCKQFLNCFKGRGSIQNCAGGSAFNPHTLECDYPDKFKCNAYKSQSDIFQQSGNLFQTMFSDRNLLVKLHAAALQKQVECPRGANGLHPNPHDCKSYLLCEHGNTKIEQCQSGKLFNSVISSCDYPENVHCTHENEREGRSGINPRQDFELITPVVKTTYQQRSYQKRTVQCPENFSGLLPHPICTKFLNCDNGRTFVQDCGPGTVFNPKISTCDWPHNVNCQDSYDDGNSEYVSGSNNQGVSITTPECPPGFTGFYPHPEKCALYLICNNGQTQIKECTSGKYYNHVTEQCDWISNVNCREITVTDVNFGQSCPGNGLFPHPTDEKLYLNCTTGYPVMQTCPNELIFCPTTLQCLYKAGSLRVCEPGFVGLKPHPNDCAKFINCNNREELIQVCGSGTVFNRFTGRCDLRSNVNCAEWYPDQFEIGTEIRFFPAISQMQLIKCPPGKTGFLPHPYCCQSYLRCDQGKTFILHCGPGKIFNSQTLQCDTSTHCSQTIPHLQTIEDNSEIKCLPGIFGLIPHPNNCQLFINCANSRATIQQCFPGTLFNPISLVCDSPENVDCPNKPVPIHQESYFEPKCPSGFFGIREHPYKCNQYLKCGSGKTVIQNCEPGLNFNIKFKRCEKNVDCGNRVITNSISDAHDVKCPSGYSGLKPHPSDCNQYLNCDRGRTTILSCGIGMMFDRRKLQCNFASKVQCNDDYIHEPLKLTCPPGFYGVQPHPQFCNQYLNCGSGIPIPGKCPPTMLFSPTKLKCDWAERVHCVDQLDVEEAVEATSSLNIHCPEGYKGLLPHPTDCKQYYDCNRLQLSQCSSGYFNPNTLNCDSQVRGIVNSNTSIQGEWKYVQCPGNYQGLIAHPFDCKQYFDCGRKTFGSCAPGSFDTNLRQCTSNVDCDEKGSIESGWNWRVVECPSGYYGYLPHPFDSKQYFDCRTGTFAFCEPGSFNPQTKQCDHQRPSHNSNGQTQSITITQIEEGKPITVQSGSKVIRCPPGYKGLLPHPLSCKRYFDCRTGQFGVCKSGFNTNTNQCDDQIPCEDKYQWSDSTGSTSSISITQTGLPTSMSKVLIECPPGYQGLLAHPYSCKRYFDCKTGQFGTCEQGSFNVITKRCDYNTPCDDKYEWSDYTQTGSSSQTQQGGTTGSSSQTQQGGTTGSSQTQQGGTTGSSQTHFISNEKIKCPSRFSGLLPHPGSCNLFIQCDNGRAFVQICGPGTVYNHKILGCDWPSNVPNCSKTTVGPPIPGSELINWEIQNSHQEFGLNIPTTTNTVKCPEGSSGLQPYPNNLKLYLNCNNGQTVVKVCPQGQYFNPEILSCTASSSENIQDGTCRDGYIASHPRFCNAYLECVQGKLYIRECSSGSVFNPQTSRCDSRQNVNCGTLTIGVINLNYTENMLGQFQSFQIGSSLVKCPEGRTGLFEHPILCNLYLQCSNGETFIQQCSAGTVFNPRISNCDWPDKVDCKDRRIGTLEEFQGVQQFQTNQHSSGSLGQQGGQVSQVIHSGEKVIQIGQHGVHQQFQTNQQNSGSLDQQEVGSQQGHFTQNFQTGTQIDSHSFGKVKCPENFTGKVIHPFFCNLFLECRNGQTFIKQCNSGMLFNSVNSGCDWEKNVNCGSRTIGVIESSTTQEHSSQYGTGQIGQTGTTSSQYQFEQRPSKNTDQYDVTKIISVSGNLGLIQNIGGSLGAELAQCPPGHTGLLPHPIICQKYLECTNGRSFIRDCGPGTVFNPKISNCDWPQNVNCPTSAHLTNEQSSQNFVVKESGVKGFQQTGFTQNQINTGEVSQNRIRSTKIECPKNYVGLYPHASLCNRYLECNNGVTIPRECSPGTLYDIQRQTCDWPKNVNCGLRRIGSYHTITQSSQLISQLTPPQVSCAGKTGRFPHPTSCSQYIECYKSRQTVQECEPGQVFNALTLICDSARNVDCGNRHILASVSAQTSNCGGIKRVGSNKLEMTPCQRHVGQVEQSSSNSEWSSQVEQSLSNPEWGGQEYTDQVSNNRMGGGGSWSSHSSWSSSSSYGSGGDGVIEQSVVPTKMCTSCKQGVKNVARVPAV